MGETLTIATNRNPDPQICDTNSVDIEACSNPKNKVRLQDRTDAQPIVKQMVDMFQQWEDNHFGYQRMTSVKQPPAASGNAIPSHEDADYSEDECQSYHGDSSQKDFKKPHTFTDEEKIQFEAV